MHLVAPSVAHAVNRISYTPANPSALRAGQSNTLTFSLDEPIICPDGVACEVSLTFTNSSPSTISLSTTTLVWTNLQWNQNRTLTLTADSDLVYSDSSSVTVSSTAASNSEYYRNYSVSITQAITLPPSPEQIAAAERAAAAEAARLRQLEIDNFRELLFAKLFRGERPTLKEYTDAAFYQITLRTVEVVTDRILELEPIKRKVAATIDEIAKDAAFEDDFFNPYFRPTVSTYLSYGISQVTSRTIFSTNLKVLDIPKANRKDIQMIKNIVKEDFLVDQFANPLTLQKTTTYHLIALNLISKDSKVKSTVLSGIKSRQSNILDTLEKLRKAVAIELEIIKARKDRLIAIQDKIVSRRS